MSHDGVNVFVCLCHRWVVVHAHQKFPHRQTKCTSSISTPVRNNISISPQMTTVYNGVITQVEMAQFRGNVIKEISQQWNC